MSKPRKSKSRRKRPEREARSRVADPNAAGRKAHSPDKRKPHRADKRLSFGDRHPIMRFVLIFAVCMGVFYVITITPLFERHGWIPYLDLNARVSASILNLFGEQATVDGRIVNSPRASLVIERGCDAIHPTMLFLAAVLAAPTSIRSKLFGMIVGTVFLMLTNLVRIVSLFYVKFHWPGAFQVMHVEVWQALFIFLALLCWILWASWAVRGKVVQTDDSA